jgi:ABC-type polar amino acid transport system ATPase subunit
MTELLAVDALRLARGSREVLKGISIDVARGQLVALMGLSGCGKTTALRSVCALEPFDSGSIHVDGISLSSGPVPPESRLRELRRRVGMVFQTNALFEHLTALDNVMLSPVHVHGESAALACENGIALLESLGVGSRASAYPRELSGGEAQRVAIARALAVDPPLLLMDEPTASLDPARRGSLGETLRALTKEGRGLLIATHDVDFARDFADRVCVLAQGVVVEEGPPDDILASPRHAATRDLLQHQPRRDV